MRRRVRLSVVAILAVGVVVLGTTAVAGASVGDKKLTKCQPKTAAKPIAKLLTVVTNSTSAAEGAKEFALKPSQVSAFTAVLQASADATKASGVRQGTNLGAAHVKVQCQGKTKANFTYDLVQNPAGQVLVPGVQGNAVLKKGKWLLDPIFVCARLSHSPFASQASAGPACYTAIGLKPPTP
jgi:hypothetical protein